MANRYEKIVPEVHVSFPAFSEQHFTCGKKKWWIIRNANGSAQRKQPEGLRDPKPFHKKGVWYWKHKVGATS